MQFQVTEIEFDFTDDLDDEALDVESQDEIYDEVIGQITKNVDMKKIDEEFLIDLKIEMDDKFGDEEEFEIETE